MKRVIVVLMVVFGVSALVAQQQQQGRGGQAPQGQTAAPGQGRGEGRGGAGGGAAFGAAPAAFTPPPGAVELQYEATAGIVKLPPDVGTLGEVVGVARNSKGDFFIYTRAEKQHLYQFDRTGKFLRELGKGGYFQDFAHVVRVDKEDNV